MGGNRFDMGKLAEADGCRHVGHVEFAAQDIDIETVEAAAGNALQAIFFCEACFFGIVQHQAAAFG